MHIRQAQPGDRDAVFILARDFATSFEVQRGPFNISFRKILDDPDALLLVAEDDGDVIGYCCGLDHDTLFANGSVAWVEEITVRASKRQSGIGKLLMTAFEDWARNRNSKYVALGTRRAADFYLAIGYEESAVYFRKLL